MFNVRLSVLERWSFQLAREGVESHSDLVNSFKYIYKVRKAEANPREVPYEMGWNPYKAKTFLSSNGLDTGLYNKNFDDEWSSSSPMVEFGDGLLPDNVAYYVEGVEGVASTLKIKVNVNDANRSDTAQRKLLDLANILSLTSINQELSEKMKDAVLHGKQYFENYGNKKIIVVTESWLGHRFNGYDVKFVISSI